MRSSDIVFRPAQPCDAPLITQLRQQIWATTYRGIFPDAMIDAFNYEWHAERDLSRINSQDYLVWMIRNRTENIGYLIVRKGDPLFLNSLYILPAFQKQGIGKRAFEIVARCCAENKISAFICHCQPENKNARLFYEKMGGVIIGYDMDNEEAWQNSVIYQFGNHIS